MNYELLMRLALDSAIANSKSEVPVSALVSDARGNVLSLAANSVVSLDDPTAHAEILAIRKMGRSAIQDHSGELSLIVTLEPCPMCAWAIVTAGFSKVIFGAFNESYGAGGSVYDHLRDGLLGRRVEVVGGVLEVQCRDLLSAAFSDIRNTRSR